jgi:hypothetical protein
LEEGHDVRGHDVSFIFGTLFCRERAFVAFLCQFTDASLGFFITSQAG